MDRFVLLRGARGSSVAMLLRKDDEYAWIIKWRSSRGHFTKHVKRVRISEIVGDALPSDPRRIAAEAAYKKGAED